MKQILQNLTTGDMTVVDVPCPRPDTGRLVIRTTRSLISAGTERMLVDFGRASLVGKARRQPDKVRRVVEKARTDGWLPALDAVRDRLDQPLPMGYCNVGVVDDVGEGVRGFERGNRVVSNGRHAEMVSVPITLCARIPDAVSDEAAAFTVIGAIALQGPHHLAQKSTRTGTSESSTSCSNVASVTSMGLPICFLPRFSAIEHSCPCLMGSFRLPAT